MKIAIESNDGITIKSPFLPTKGYVVYDISESNIVNSEYRDCPSKSKKVIGSRELVSAKPVSLINDCTAIISRGMDRNNLDVFKKEGKDVYITFKTSTRDAVRFYLREQIIGNKLAH